MNNDSTAAMDIRIVKLMLRNKFEDILVLRRSSTHPTYAGYPDFPGGVLLVGESDQDALWRKLSEETGLVLTTDKAVKISERTLPIYKKETVTHALYILKVDMDNPRIMTGWQHDHYEWLPPERLGEFDPPLQECIDDARDFFLPPSDGVPWATNMPRV